MKGRYLKKNEYPRDGDWYCSIKNFPPTNKQAELKQLLEEVEKNPNYAGSSGWIVGDERWTRETVGTHQSRGYGYFVRITK